VKPFVYLRPASVADAADALAAHDGEAKIIAGGQTLLLALKDRLMSPTVLVSLQDVAETRGISHGDDGTLRIGATTTYSQLENSNLSGAHRLLPTVAADVADGCVRRMGTIGGALCHADPAFDMPLAAVVSSAELELVSSGQARRLPASEFLLGPCATALGPGEVLTAIHLPAAERSARFAFVKHRLRRFDSAIVSVACLLSLEDRKVVRARIACGSVGPIPLRLTAAEDLLVGHEVSESLLREAGDRAADGIELGTPSPVLRQSYKRDVLPAIVVRALQTAVDGSE
jgi:carbon-monoxide dehydrogenase medium subunit